MCLVPMHALYSGCGCPTIKQVLSHRTHIVHYYGSPSDLTPAFNLRISYLCNAGSGPNSSDVAMILVAAGARWSSVARPCRPPLASTARDTLQCSRNPWKRQVPLSAVLFASTLRPCRVLNPTINNLHHPRGSTSTPFWSSTLPDQLRTTTY